MSSNAFRSFDANLPLALSMQEFYGGPGVAIGSERTLGADFEMTILR